jgi:hypothetical protein
VNIFVVVLKVRTVLPVAVDPVGIGSLAPFKVARKVTSKFKVKVQVLAPNVIVKF